MNLRRRSFFVFVTILGSLAAGPAAFAQRIPFYAEGFGTYNPVAQGYVAPGVGTRLGRYVNSGELELQPTIFPNLLRFESSTANLGLSDDGTVLETEFRNGLVLLQPGEADPETGETIFTATWLARVVVTGGEGAYSGVRGTRRSLWLVAVNEPFKLSDPEWNFSWKLFGDVRLDGPKSDRVRRFNVLGEGNVTALPSAPGEFTTWSVSGIASLLGRYTSPSTDSPETNLVTLDVDEEFSPLEGRIPFSGTSTFIGQDGSELALDFEGFITILPDGNLRWLADFTPAIGASTGRFSTVVDGSVVMIASSPFAPVDINFEWFGSGDMTFNRR